MVDDLILAAAIAALTAAGLSALLVRSGVLDIPRLTRNAHTQPTPTAGGIAIAAGFAAGLAAATLPIANDWALELPPSLIVQAGAVALAAAGALAVGFLDDLRPLGALSKSLILGAGAFAFAALVARAQSFPVFATMALDVGLVFGVLGSALWIFTLVNATNFADGANGLAMGSIAIGLAGAGGVALMADTPHVALLAFCGAAALAGFLVWNFPRARLFAGDSGSLFAGALAACVSLALVQEGGVSPLIPPLLFFPILADVLLTLWWRFSQRRSNLLDGHREHMYQIGLRAGLSHTQVTLIYWAAGAHCALVAFLASLGARLDPGGLPDDGFMGLAAHLGAWLVGLAPALALVALALLAMRLHGRVRRFAASRGLDQP